jgi:type IV secretory pathway component VirB8
VTTENRTPPSATKEGYQRWLDVFEMPAVQARKMTLIAIGACTVAVMESFAIMAMLPLKEKVPYFVEVENATGKVVASDQVATHFKPDEKNLRYFFGRWAENLMTIDTRTKDYLLPSSYVLLRGQALGDWQDWVEKRDMPLKKLAANPGLRREVRVSTITFIADGVALIRVTLSEAGPGASRIESRKAITLHYSLIPPASDDDVMKNPLGINITNFTINDELV